jgi:hypothetical protein
MLSTKMNQVCGVSGQKSGRWRCEEDIIEVAMVKGCSDPVFFFNISSMFTHSKVTTVVSDRYELFIAEWQKN